jgi:hypothetical protein
MSELVIKIKRPRETFAAHDFFQPRPTGGNAFHSRRSRNMSPTSVQAEKQPSPVATLTVGNWPIADLGNGSLHAPAPSAAARKTASKMTISPKETKLPVPKFAREVAGGTRASLILRKVTP